MLIHRITTWSHMIARSPSRYGDPYNVSFDFNDLNLSGGSFAFDQSDLERSISYAAALEHRREVNEEQCMSRYRRFVEECGSKRHLRGFSNDEERRGLVMSREELDARSEADNDII